MRIMWFRFFKASLFKFWHIWLSVVAFILMSSQMSVHLDQANDVSSMYHYDYDHDVGGKLHINKKTEAKKKMISGIPQPKRQQQRKQQQQQKQRNQLLPPLVSLNNLNAMPNPDDRCSRKLHIPTQRWVNDTEEHFVKETDRAYFHCGTSPVVIPEFKLIFFWVPKVACSTFKILFHKMIGVETENLDWAQIHRPEKNALTYLFDYNLTYASDIIQDPTWTKAIFVRNPHERLVSAYLDKGPSTKYNYIRKQCCAVSKDCMKLPKGKKAKQLSTSEQQLQLFDNFLKLIQTCPDIHWLPQSMRLEPKYYPYINFVGYFDTIQHDTESMLKRVGAWEKYGQAGWGPNGDRAVFEPDDDTKAKHDPGRPHATDAKDRLRSFFFPSNGNGKNNANTMNLDLFGKVTEYYRGDYDSPVLKLQPPPDLRALL